MSVDSYTTNKGRRWRSELYIDGKRVASKRGFIKKSKALIWEEGHREKYLNDPQGLNTKQFTFDNLSEDYVRIHLSKKRFNTKRRYLEDIDLRLIPKFTGRKLNSISKREIEEYQNDLHTGKYGFSYAAKSVNECIFQLKRMFDKAIDWNMMIKNSAAGIIPLKNEDCDDYEWWENPNDIIKFLDTSKKYWLYEFYYTALNTGMRISELIGLDRSNIDFGKNIIRVRKQYPNKVKELSPLKTKQSRRDIDMNDNLVKILEKAISKSKHPTAVFSSKIGNRVKESTADYETWVAIIKKAGISRICFHGLRHTFASHYMINGGNLWHLKQILGHASIKQTEKYAHLSREHIKPSVVSFNPSI